MGEPSRCIPRPSYYPPGGNICEPAFQDRCDSEHVLIEVTGIVAVDNNIDLNYRYGAASGSGELVSDFFPSYLGTLVLDVPATSKGLYTLGFNPHPNLTFLEDDQPIPNQIPIAALIPGQIDVSCGQDDCDRDGVTDWEETSPGQQDCDRDGICNGFEIADCTPGEPDCADCNGNQIPDACETDCNGNQVADSCDIAQCAPGDPACTDCDGNGIPDGCQTDCNNNQVADVCDIENCLPGDESCADCNENQSPDGCEEGGCCLDVDQDGVFESCSPGSRSVCDGLNGIWRGVCGACPTQNSLIVAEPGGNVFVHVIGAPIDCAAESRDAARQCTGGPFYDAWKSDADASMCHNFGAPGHSIPADFFDPGSDVFASPVCLHGVPLGAPGFGEADTLIERSADPFGRCGLPSPVTSEVQIAVYALKLEAIEPITITYGGANPELWAVTVDRSAVDPPPGTLTVTKSHCNGGTYTSVLNVQPRFTFTKVGDPGMVRVLDTGLAGIPFVTLDQQNPAPWVQDVDSNLGLTGDPCSSFHAGIEDVQQSTSCDCNANLQRDVCDLESASSPDCNRNAVPDECDLSTGSSLDAVVVNGIPDECDPGPVPLADPTGIHKSRFITFSVPSGPASAGLDSAVRVKLTSLHHVDPPYNGGPSIPFTSHEGLYRWVGPPVLEVESLSTEIPFYFARLQCQPHYRNWSTVGILHVTGSAIVPSSIYEVQTVAATCEGDEGACLAVSEPLVIATGRWADVETPFNPPSTTIQPDLGDVAALINKFRSLVGAPIKARALLIGDDLAGNILSTHVDLSFTHIASCVDAFRGRPYPHIIEDCP